MKKTKTPQTPQLQAPDTQSKRRLSLPKVAYSAFLCVMMSMMFCQPAYAATDVWTKAKEIMQDVYTQILAISTIAAIVTASVALLLMNFSRSGRTVDESRAWLKRICITWAILNGLGFNGVVRFCPDCGKQIPRCRTLCDCDAVVQRRQQEENRKEKERLEKAEKHEPNALGSLFTMAQSDFYPHNEGYFSCWEDFFDSWNEDCEEFVEKPLYVWGTEDVEMSLDASSIVSDACEDMYEDAYDDIGADAVAEMQRYLDEWKKKYGRTSYLLTTKHAIRIPWEEMK